MSELIFYAEPPSILELQLKLRKRREQSKMTPFISFPSVQVKTEVGPVLKKIFFLRGKKVPAAN